MSLSAMYARVKTIFSVENNVGRPVLGQHFTEDTFAMIPRQHADVYFSTYAPKRGRRWNLLAIRMLSHTCATLICDEAAL